MKKVLSFLLVFCLLYGTNPDLPCKPSESPYDAVLQYIDME